MQSATAGIKKTVIRRAAATESPFLFRMRRLAPAIRWALALFFALWALRGVTADNVVDTDAARHAMNGVFIRDMIASGSFRHPINYARFYYSHWPALSMPYHPPMFPLVEGLGFLLFGVHLLTTRVLIAAGVAGCVLLLWRIIRLAGGSEVLAFCSVVTFFSLAEVQGVAGDVMLEIPAFVFTLAAIYFLRDLDSGFPLKRAVPFAILAGCALWTKQTTVFLGMVPFLFVLFARRWRILLRPGIWVASALIAASVISLSLLSLPFHGAGVDQVTRPQWFFALLFRNLGYYVHALRKLMGWPLEACVGLSLAASLVFLKPRMRLFTAWAISAFIILLLIGPIDPRYLFFCLPALFVCAYAILEALGVRFLGPLHGRWAPLVFALFFMVGGIGVPATFMRGPSEVASLLVNGAPQRILYCGSTDGNFVFSARTRDPNFNTVVIAGDKLPAETFTPENLDKFVAQYKVRYVVVERTNRVQAADSLIDKPASSMTFLQDVPLSSSSPRWQGKLRIYRVRQFGSAPAGNLFIPLPKAGTQVEVQY